LVSPSPGKKASSVPIKELTKYFKSAHGDARKYFHKICNLNLHPTGNEQHHIGYPESLPEKAKKGMFGEVMCGLFVETYSLFDDKKDFSVPVFLFRHHDGVEDALTRLKRGGTVTEIPGRLGDDFIGLEMDEDGWVIGFIVGEAKYRKKLTSSVYESLMNTKDKILKRISSDHYYQSSMNKLKRILEAIDSKEFERIILSIEEMDSGKRSVERTDFVLLVTAELGKRKAPPYSRKDGKPSEHSINRPLAVAEVTIPTAEALISNLYKNLYSGEEND